MAKSDAHALQIGGTASRLLAHWLGSYASQTWAIAAAEVQKLHHDPLELVTRAVQPMLWLLLFGEVMAQVRGVSPGHDEHTGDAGIGQGRPRSELARQAGESRQLCVVDTVHGQDRDPDGCIWRHGKVNGFVNGVAPVPGSFAVRKLRLPRLKRAFPGLMPNVAIDLHQDFDLRKEE